MSRIRGRRKQLKRVLAVGLTGGIGMGKSTGCELLRRRGIPVVDSDLIAREIVEPGRPALAEVRARFGGDILDSQGRLRRDELARRVFADEAARRDLEGILHPRIRESWRARLESWRAEGQPVAVAIIPLLFEVAAEDSFDVTICVACTATTQRERLRTRGWNDDQIGQRLKAQWPVEKKMLRADYVVWTEGGVDVHEEQLRRIIP
jgi:dephospho-CoA kinase